MNNIPLSLAIGSTAGLLLVVFLRDRSQRRIILDLRDNLAKYPVQMTELEAIQLKWAPDFKGTISEGYRSLVDAYLAQRNKIADDEKIILASEEQKQELQKVHKIVVDAMQTQLEESKKAREEQEIKIDEMSTRVCSLTAANAKHENNFEFLQGQINAIKTEGTARRKQFELLEKEKADAQSEVDNLRIQVNSLNSDPSSQKKLKEDVKTLREGIHRISVNHNSLNATLKLERQGRREAEDMRERHYQNVLRLENELDELHKALKDAESRKPEIPTTSRVEDDKLNHSHDDIKTDSGEKLQELRKTLTDAESRKLMAPTASRAEKTVDPLHDDTKSDSGEKSEDSPLIDLQVSPTSPTASDEAGPPSSDGASLDGSKMDEEDGSRTGTEAEGKPVDCERRLRPSKAHAKRRQLLEAKLKERVAENNKHEPHQCGIEPAMDYNALATSTKIFTLDLVIEVIDFA